MRKTSFITLALLASGFLLAAAPVAVQAQATGGGVSGGIGGDQGAAGVTGGATGDALDGGAAGGKAGATAPGTELEDPTGTARGGVQGQVDEDAAGLSGEATGGSKDSPDLSGEASGGAAMDTEE